VAASQSPTARGVSDDQDVRVRRVQCFEQSLRHLIAIVNVRVEQGQRPAVAGRWQSVIDRPEPRRRRHCGEQRQHGAAAMAQYRQNEGQGTRQHRQMQPETGQELRHGMRGLGIACQDQQQRQRREAGKERAHRSQHRSPPPQTVGDRPNGAVGARRRAEKQKTGPDAGRPIPI